MILRLLLLLVLWATIVPVQAQQATPDAPAKTVVIDKRKLLVQFGVIDPSMPFIRLVGQIVARRCKFAQHSRDLTVLGRRVQGVPAHQPQQRDRNQGKDGPPHVGD